MKKRIISSLLICAMSITLLAGCGGAGNSSEKQESSKSGASESIVRITVADTPVMDPAVGMTEAALSIYPNVYDTLVWPEADGTVSNYIAEDYTVSEDGTSYDFKLKNGIKFHDGSELNAEDVKYSMDRAIEIGQGLGFLFAKKVKSTEVVDDYTVRFNLTQPSGVFVSSLARLYIVNKDLLTENQKEGAYGENGDFGMGYLQNQDAGSGAYKVEKFEQDQSVTVCKFEDYWDGFDEKNPEKAQFIIVDETVTQVTMMSNRELEISNPYLALETYEQLDAIDGIDVAGFYKGDVMSISTNTKKAPLDDEHVRKALAYCVDYDTLVNILYPDSKRLNSCVPPSVMGYTDTAFDVSFDIDKAKEELAQSKYADNIGDYEMEIAWVSNCPDREKIALMLQENAAKLGMKLSIVEVPWASIVETSATPETTYHMVTVITVPDYSEAGSIFETSFPNVKNGNPNTMSWAGSEELDAKIADAIGTIDTAEREAKYVALQEEFMKNVPTIPLFEQNFRYAYQSAYLEWGAAERSKAGEQAVPAMMGYNLILKDMKLSLEK